MNKIIQLKNRTITLEEIVPLLAGYQMLPQLWRELIIDQAIAPIELTSQEQARAEAQFEELHQLTTKTECQVWLERYGMTYQQLQALATRQLRIEKFKQANWGSKLESYFLNCKSKLNKVIYSLIRTTEAEVANELYFRIQAGEQSSAEVAREHSQGPEAHTGGLLGPVELSMLHPTLAKMLSISQSGQIWPPTSCREWLMIVRLEKLIPAQLDEPMRSQLLNSLLEGWLCEQINQLGAVRLQDTAIAREADDFNYR